MKVFGIAISVFLLFVLPAGLIKVLYGSVPQPYQFILLFAVLPMAITLGAFWARWQLGVLAVIFTWGAGGIRMADILGNYDHQVYTDLARVGRDMGFLNLAFALVLLLISIGWHYCRK